jgi:hypothetical protein
MTDWRDIEGWTGFYQVSDEGAVRSVDRRWPVVNRFGNTEMRLHRGQVLKAPPSKNGYPMVSFTRPGGVREYVYVHHLVAQAFLGEKPEGMEICHRNGIRADCRAANLRYDTRSGNALDRHVHGTMNQARGEKHYFSKLTAEDVRLIRQLRPGTPIRELAVRFGVTHKTIASAAARESWKHV